MKPFLLGFMLVYALGVGIVLAMDQAVKPNNPWVLSFALSAFIVPVACGWGGAEVAALVLRRRTLEPGRSHWAWRMARGMIAGLIGVSGAIVLAAIQKLGWPDYVCTAATAFPAALLFASIGRQNARAWACAQCGYDLRGLTKAARGRCPECGTSTVVAAS